MKIRTGALWVFVTMMAFSAFAAMFLYSVGQDALRELNAFQFFADSNTYHKIYADEFESHDGTLVGVSKNYAGPLLVLALFGGNIYLVMMFNVYLFSHSLLVVTRRLQLPPLQVTLLLMLSPLTLSSLLSVNKEIFFFPFLAFALTAHLRRSMTLALLALGMSILVRWLLTAFYVVMLGLTLPIHIAVRRRTVLVGLLVAASVAYVALLDFLAPVIDVVERSIADYDEGGSGLFARMLDLQKQGLYLLVFPVKAFHLMFGLGLRLDRLINPGNIYNDVFVLLHCTVSLLTFMRLLIVRRFSLSSDLVFASVVFLIVFCLSPVFAPRYLYPVFVLWMLVLAGAPQRLRPRPVHAAAPVNLPKVSA